MGLRLTAWLAVLAASSAFTAAASLAEVPDCGVACIEEKVLSSSCTLTHQACICANEELQQQISVCVTESCSIRDALSVEKYSAVSCDQPVVDNSKKFVITVPLFGALACFFFILRVISRVIVGLQTWGADDWIMMVCVLVSIPMFGMSLLLGKHGLGKDMWMVDPDDITEVLYLYYWDEIMYLFIISFTKVSVLVFYLRIFPRKAFRVWAWILIAANIALGLAFVLSTVFQCTPINGAWVNWDGAFEGKCRDVGLIAWLAAGSSIVLDVATISLPLPELWRLNMARKKRIQIMLMFAVGFFVTVVASFRVRYLVHFVETTNLTQDFVPIGVWSAIEASVGIVCACLPAVSSLVAVLFPKLLCTTERTTNPSAAKRSKTADLQRSGEVSREEIQVRKEIVVRYQPKEASSFMELQTFFADYDPHHGLRKEVTPRESV
ncbi:hypothetical protein F5Y15DRAFT_236005 [Xylariaceae sp. FL0016]|nr:hypothetical protein F5Y15DRAFT_236005 [Xylariaceae sp. FL0016]